MNKLQFWVDNKNYQVFRTNNEDDAIICKARYKATEITVEEYFDYIDKSHYRTSNVSIYY